MTQACITVTAVTPENVVSNLLTVEPTSCEALCTIVGNVGWTNSGGTASAAADLKIRVNSDTSVTLATGVVIQPGGTAGPYPFSMPNLTKGEYVVSTIPPGVASQTITVTNPAHITALTIESNTLECTAPCTSTINITVIWQNIGDVSGSFIPAITVTNGANTTRYEKPTVTLDAGLPSSPIVFTIPNLTLGQNVVCPDPTWDGI
jgi:hypothetical protein